MKKLIIALILGMFLLPLPSYAFNEDFIISDQELADYSSMSLEEIRGFLSEKNSFLSYFADFYPGTGMFMDGAQIIYNTAQEFKINPKFILVMLEKEQSLITYSSINMRRLDWAMGYAVCDNCELNHPLVAQYRGFAKQVYFAVNRIMNTFISDLQNQGATHTGFGPGISKKVDYSYWITPQNNATAALYTYTPHYLGNKNFYLIWTKWFSSIAYPDGSLLQDAKTGGIYLIQNGTKRPFVSKTVFKSKFSEESVIPVGQSVLQKYPTGYPIKFADYSLLQDKNGNLYMTVGDEARPFESETVFRSIGFSPFELEEITAEDLLSYKIGSPITQASAYPTGGLLQYKETGGVYWVYDGKKYPIWHKSVLTTRFPGRNLTQVSSNELDKYSLAEPIKFLDGSLVKDEKEPNVYFISDGKLRSIPSEDVFLTYGWKWENIIWTNSKVLGLYEMGEPIMLNENIGEATTQILFN
ncbi:hypothetical protein KKB41_03990 [Patescibacteria group bacterium]|nr:hypothetical protein [Patescibacteria group bacterium]